MNQDEREADRFKEPTIDHEFARRMKIACDNIPRMPPGKGRAAWIHRELLLRGVKVSHNTVHCWYIGLMRPRNQKLLALAEVLKVDSSWLANGQIPEVTVEQRRRLDVNADASVNVLVGFVQMAGYQCAAPEEDDPLKNVVHFYSIVNGRQRRFHAAFGRRSEGSKYIFNIPSDHEKCTVIGVVSMAPLSAEFVRFPTALINSAAETKNGSLRLEVDISSHGWKVGDQVLRPLREVSDMVGE